MSGIFPPSEQMWVMNRETNHGNAVAAEQQEGGVRNPQEVASPQNIYYSIAYYYICYIHYYYALLTFRVSFSMLTTILVSSHCTLWAMGTSWLSSRSAFSQERLLREGRKSSGGGNRNGRLERAPSPGWGLLWRRMDNSGGNMLSAGSATSKWHKQIKFHEK